MSGLLSHKVYTLAIIRNEAKILLGYKKRGFGKGKWNGFGGKVEEGESIIDAALREVKEECGLEPKDLTKIGTLEFQFLENPEIMKVNVFKSEVFTGEVAESEEMLPKWFHKDDIPYANMWPDDKHWLPLLLTNQSFSGFFLYDEGENILEKRLTVLDSIPVV
uniref:Oxidized purine nucleoside triphosphate hydrolase n=1 Tax=Graphocephala atropunctata TaxID=36148 RepID=A0A1B6KAA9_9HEMI